MIKDADPKDIEVVQYAQSSSLYDEKPFSPGIWRRISLPDEKEMA